MDIRTDFILQLLHKLGAPLMQAVNCHSSGNGETDAQTLANLLSESVKISISLSQSMNIREQDGNSDAIRVALASLAGGLIADSYRQTGRLLKDNDVARISSSLQSVIVFADSFAPAAEHSKRLKTLDGTPPFFDEVQSNIYAIHALMPAMAAIGEFSFGQQDTKLIQDVAQKLRSEAKGVLAKFTPDVNPMSELVVLNALAQIYAGAHRAQTQKLKGGGDAAPDAFLAAIWTDFGKQLVMVETLMAGLSGTGTQSSSGSGSGQSPDVNMSPETQAAVAPPAQNSGASPMAFFKKK